MRKIIEKIQFLFVPTKENDFRPKFLESDFLLYCLIIILILKVLVLPFFIYLPKTDFFAEISRSLLIELTNKERVKMGLNPLRENPLLDRAAFLKAQDILTYDYFSHYSPQGKSPWYWFKVVNYNFQKAGENLGIGFLDSKEIHRAWKNSPSHRENLLNPSYQEIGIAVLSGEFNGNETTVVVQLFGSPKQTAKLSSETVQIEKKEISPLKNSLVHSSKNTPSQSTTSNQGEETSVLSKSSVSLSAVKETDIKSKLPLSFSLLKFITVNYPDLVQKIIYYSLILVIISFAIAVFVNFRIQDPNLVLRTLLFILLMGIFVMLDKELFLHIMPHNLNIF